MVTLGVTGRRPEHPHVSKGAIGGHGIVQVNQSGDPVAGSPARPTPVGQCLHVGRLDLQNPGIERIGVSRRGHPRLGQQRAR